ncbi:MAG: type II secretion system F family protein [Vicinamibacterales bacterium]
MEFRCRLGTPSGDIVEGLYVADDEAKLKREFEERGMLVLHMSRTGALSFSGLRLPERQRISSREFLVFNQELATLIKAGMPLVQSLDILRQRITGAVFRSVLDDVYERVRSGGSLSEAFEAHANLFPGIYTASLLAGEKSGGLEQVLRRYVAYAKVVGAVKRRTLSALIYPFILVGLSLAVVSIIVLRAVPEFARFYETFGNRQLPWVTQLLVGVSAALREHFLLILLVGVGAGVAIWRYLRQPVQRMRFDRWILKVPLAGPTTLKFSTSQLARTLSTLLGGGIPLVNAIDVASRATSNRHMGAELLTVSKEVREGRSFAHALESRGLFPDVAIKMVEVGEQTGALQEMLNSLADFYDEEIETSLGRFVTVIEPTLLVVMGIVIAGLLLALYLPVFQLSSIAGG